MKEDIFGNEVLVEGRVKLLQVIDPSGLKNPDDFFQGAFPIRHMMEDAEAEDRVQGARPGRDTHDIGHIEKDLLPFSLREIGSTPADHMEVQVHGLEDRGLKFFADDGGTRTAPAAHFQDNASGCQGLPSLHPVNLESLLDGTGGIVDRPSFSPV